MEALKKYLQGKGYSTATVITILKHLHYFARWCEGENITDLTEVSHNDVVAHGRYLQGSFKRSAPRWKTWTSSGPV